MDTTGHDRPKPAACESCEHHSHALFPMALAEGAIDGAMVSPLLWLCEACADCAEESGDRVELGAEPQGPDCYYCGRAITPTELAQGAADECGACVAKHEEAAR